MRPTVGRIVHFHSDVEPLGDQPLAAIIAYVWSDTLVNLSVSDAQGSVSGRCRIMLKQPDEDMIPDLPYCEFPPRV